MLDGTVDSTPTIWCIALVDTTGVGTLKDLLINYFGTTNFLLILLVFAFFWIRHLRNRLTESDDREQSFERAHAASKMRADALEERLRISGDRAQLVEERGKIVEQRNLLTDQKLAAGEDLLRLVSEMRSITDLVMPVLDGFQLIERIRDNHTNIAVLAVSAYVDNAAQIVSKIGAFPARFEFLPKPITLGILLDGIRRLINKGNDTGFVAAAS